MIKRRVNEFLVYGKPYNAKIGTIQVRLKFELGWDWSELSLRFTRILTFDYYTFHIPPITEKISMAPAQG